MDKEEILWFLGLIPNKDEVSIFVNHGKKYVIMNLNDLTELIELIKGKLKGGEDEE